MHLLLKVEQWNTFYGMTERCGISRWAFVPYGNVKFPFHVY